eukprot:snap_masked-scaffold_13-processed-gene-11.8-mRNA-1 protein AED:1.00 eAED:1.00 QI:0/0/0/0/1/1/2/0/86
MRIPASETLSKQILLDLLYSLSQQKLVTKLEHLGAATVVNTGERPAGSNMYMSYLGYPIGQGNIPFLDTSYEFFEDLYEKIRDSSE